MSSKISNWNNIFKPSNKNAVSTCCSYRSLKIITSSPRVRLFEIPVYERAVLIYRPGAITYATSALRPLQKFLHPDKNTERNLVLVSPSTRSRANHRLGVCFFAAATDASYPPMASSIFHESSRRYRASREATVDARTHPELHPLIDGRERDWLCYRSCAVVLGAVIVNQLTHRAR